MAEDKKLEVLEDDALDGENTVKLSKSLRGKDELTFNFEKITGSVLLKCEKRAKETDSSILVPQISMVYQAHVAAAALGVKYDEIINLPGKDFMAVTTKVSRFLNGTE